LLKATGLAFAAAGCVSRFREGGHVAREVNPQDTERAAMNAPNPMVTFFKTLDVTNLIRVTEENIDKTIGGPGSNAWAANT
jgi:hypothetical protein